MKENLTKKDYEDFGKSTKCWICKESLKKGNVKVKYDDHITGKYRGSGHKDCNLNLTITKKKPLLCFIIWIIMIHIFCFQKL